MNRREMRIISFEYMLREFELVLMGYDFVVWLYRDVG